MDWSYFWEGFTPKFLDFWNFFRAFLYGGVGGISLFLMSYINTSSSLVETKNKLQFSTIESHTASAQKTNSWRSRFFRLKVALVHFVVGGVSGMIAVNSFNPSANELQTFSIAAIAGLSGFAFLKRSALADDNNSEKILNVELTPLLSIEEDVHDFIDELKSLQTEERDLEDEVEQFEATYLPRNISQEESSELSLFLTRLKDSELITEDDAIFFSNLKSEGYTDKEIIDHILEILEDL